jgi:DNA-binding NarL/FixJ family response regulator
MSAVLLSDDLMFTSRITGTARDLGLNVAPARTPDAAVDLARRESASCVILDIAAAGRDLPYLVARLNALSPPPRVVAYGSHVDTASLQAARAVGCDPVLPRSKFVELLPRELPGWLASEKENERRG